MKRTGVSRATGFTLIELLVVVTAIAILASVLMPALCRARYEPTVTACKANYRQWGVACNLYAADNSRGAYPSFSLYLSGANAWDIALAMIPAMEPYGITVPMWFCPARPAGFDLADATCQSKTGHGIRDLTDLQTSLRYAQTSWGSAHHDVWIPRYNGPVSPNYLYPQVWNYVLGIPNPNANEVYQWPSRTIDTSVSKAPVLSDRVVGTSTNLLQAIEGHSVNGHVDSVNVLFGDGHVDLHKSSVMKWRWKGNFYTFY